MESENYPKLYLYQRIVQAKIFIDHHYTDDIDLSQIADEAFFSKFHFIRLFKQAYGKTPHHYLTQVRVNQARFLLSQGESVADVCFRIGFESSTSFSALFKKYFGVSPSVYQARQLEKRVLFTINPLHAVPNCFAEIHGLKK